MTSATISTSWIEATMSQPDTIISRAEAMTSKGVKFVPRKNGGAWVARIATNGVRILLGPFSTEAEAAEAYQQAKRAKPARKIICKICGRTFETQSKANPFFCSKRCKQDASNARTRKWRTNNPWHAEMVNALAREEHRLNPKPRRPVWKKKPKHCIVCGEEFKGHSWGLYCCKGCRRIALYARKRKQYAEDAEYREAILANQKKYRVGEDFSAYTREYRQLNRPRFLARAKRSREHMKEWVTVALEHGFKPQTLSSGRPTRKVNVIYADLRSLHVIPTLKGKY
jgi:predicted nucleic acid-binding Zn ribbon protein